jgi:hypothetical protein
MFRELCLLRTTKPKPAGPNCICTVLVLADYCIHAMCDAADWTSFDWTIQPELVAAMSVSGDAGFEGGHTSTGSISYFYENQTLFGSLGNDSINKWHTVISYKNHIYPLNVAFLFAQGWSTASGSLHGVGFLWEGNRGGNQFTSRGSV